jgi:hypothetical protein
MPSGDIPAHWPRRHRATCPPRLSLKVHAEQAAYTRTIGLFDRIKSILAGAKTDAEAVADGEVPAATPPGGGDERETSTNAQMAGARDEPWPGND